ncbi:MAG: T9SS type A sorting domain-containing protein [Flavobacterium sp. JAD_PAG50586_2]|nr:MAG: T9SS type A sorting domain-containing protein [Flavobacterium sp. JAD_PAG50586_2]
MRKTLFSIVLILLGVSGKAQFTNLHNFPTAGGYSSLTYVNGVLYGTVNSGGTNNVGYIYSMNSNGTSFTVLYNFVGDASFPCGSLLYDNGTLYGMTSQGDGVNTGGGTIYKLNIDGSGYAILHSFTYQNPNDGFSPQNSLIILGNTLYGMTRKGGAVFPEIGGEGTIFKINTDGSNFSILHSFAYGEENPYGSLLLSGNYLYGMTSTYSSNTNAGKIFKINVDGTGYVILYNFNGADGAKPNGSLVISGNTLYGMTALGGNTFTGIRKGNVFKINTDGSGFQSIYNDLNGSTNYTWSYGSLVLVGNVLFGKSNVNLYSLNTDGSNYQWYNWGGYGSTTGSFDPMENGNLTFGGGVLYGVNNRFGGDSGGGVIYKFAPSTLGVDSNNSIENLIEIYPNPTNDNIIIDFRSEVSINNYNVKIYTMLGQEVLNSIINQEQQSISLNSLCGKGIYLVKIFNDSNSLIASKKIMLK